MKRKFTKRLICALLSFVLVMSCLPLSSFAAQSNSSFNREVDANTMNNWTRYFDLNNLNTQNAGGVWTDKSVFTDASAFPSNVTMLDDNKNFLTALSALAANKEVVGYSTVPTDTVLVLDLSGSMENSNSESDLIDAANDAIKRLLDTNNNNRVGVVLYSASGSTGTSTYSESVTQILPIDRYTTGSDGEYLSLSRQGRVSVDSDVTGTKSFDKNKTKSFGGGTYIQAGLWEALKMFEGMDTVISDNNWQSGDNRMPILVLMSDGAPSTGTTNYADVDKSNVGNGNESGLTDGNAFLTQLTASYVINRIKAHYQDENSDVRGLFYTLGFNIGNNDVAKSVMNPDSSTFTDTLWNSYNNLTTGSLSVRVKNTNAQGTSYSNVAITKNSYVTNKSYVDEYFSASGSGLTDAFETLVEEILLQSRYYPTNLEGGSPDFSGYVEFTDTLGEYMEVKNVNGILLGDTLFDGHMMASKLADNSEDGLGTMENPTELGNEFIRAIKTRLGIAQTADAQALLSKALADGQLRYNGPDDWSNYISWYAKADGTYLGFYDKDGTEPVPADAVYINRSYGFLGETSGSIKNSDMMYMSVQVGTNIETGQQTVVWKIPASLVPMLTYLVTLEGTNIDMAKNVELSVENAKEVTPIRLIYETGLRSNLNEFNIAEITSPEHIAADGNTRIFWNNYFDIDESLSHDEHITTTSEFMPNKDNERFYFTFDSAVFKKTGENQYTLLEQNEAPTENGEYYHRRYVFDENSSEPIFFYEKLSNASIAAAKWDSTFETLTHEVGAWFVAKGTPARELQMYDEQKQTNPTNSARMVFHPYISEHNNHVYVDMNLGNNGLLSVTPATGIKISKTIDVFETGTSDLFKFRVTANLNGGFNSWITPLGETPSGEPITANFTNGIYEFEMKRDQTLWLSGIPAGTKYTVEEISDNADYKIKSVHVNGISTGYTATGTVAQHFIENVEFVNTALGEGDLVITKKVVDENGSAVNISDNIKFTAEVTLTNASGSAVSGSFEATGGNITVGQDGKFTVTLKEGESFVIRNIPEETKWEVKEINIPTGFTLNSNDSVLRGVVNTAANEQALIVNTYKPVATNGSDISVVINKEISGRDKWLQGESYTFTLKKLEPTTVIATATIDYNDSDKEHIFSLSSEEYTAAGTYYYSITEAKGTQGGVTYDTAERRFSVTVADRDMDGDLEITAVNNELNTVVSGSWTVTAAFNNVYAPTGSATATIDIQKAIQGGHALNGYQFALYDTDPSNTSEANEVIKSSLTDASGKATITLNFAANAAGQTFTYYLAEINRGKILNNIKYTEEVYKVEVKVIDNLDGTVSTDTIISGLAAGSSVPTFTNVYEPSSSDYITISGKKEIIGNRLLNEGEFEFVIASSDANAPMPALTRVKNMANGSFSFPAIEFGDSHKNQTFVYTISENQANPIGGFTYDKTVYTVTVTVTDNGNQQITAKAVISDGTNNVDNIVFTNIYDPIDAKVTLKGTKLLTGKTLQNGEFSFKLEAVTKGAPMPASAIVKNNATGEIVFGEITFTKSGIYNYKLTEVKGTDSRFDYDESVYDVTITVTDNSEGRLFANVALKKDNMDSSEIVFRNGFVPTPISYNITTNFGGFKGLEGRPIEDGEFDFEFILTNATSGQQIGEIVKNDENGYFKFSDVKLSSAGIYHFKITEVVGNRNGVTYDTAIYYVRVEVIQNENGELKINSQKLYKSFIAKEEVGGVLTEVTKYEELTSNEKILFNNTYAAAPTEIIIKGVKTLEGRELKAEEFSFELYDKEGKLETVKNAKDGSFEFSAISVDKAGEYVFTVRETKGDAEGITYDETVYTVKAIVTDNLDGTFKVDYAYAIGNEAVNALTFVNVYTAPTPAPETPTPPSVPQTGDKTNLTLWIALFFISGGLVTASAILKKKRED